MPHPILAAGAAASAWSAASLRTETFARLSAARRAFLDPTRSAIPRPRSSSRNSPAGYRLCPWGVVVAITVGIYALAGWYHIHAVRFEAAPYSGDSAASSSSRSTRNYSSGASSSEGRSSYSGPRRHSCCPRCCSARCISAILVRRLSGHLRRPPVALCSVACTCSPGAFGWPSEPTGQPTSGRAPSLGSTSPEPPSSTR